MSDANVLDFERPVPADTAKRCLLSLTELELKDVVLAAGQPGFRAAQVWEWLHNADTKKRVTTFAQMTNVPAVLRQHLDTITAIRTPVVADVRVAADGTRKYQLTTYDGHTIESVWIPHASGPQRHALCISSQVGCAMGCTFCATASLKLTRHLSAGEIVGQVYAVIADLDKHLPDDPPVPSSKSGFRYDPDPNEDAGTDVDAAEDAADKNLGRAKRRIQNIVYMGMGEPLHNIENVIRSIDLLTTTRGLGLSPKRLTVSTSGLAPALTQLANDTQVHLAVSLNATTDDVRKQIMPVTKRWDIPALLAACRDFPVERRRRITFEYVLLKDVNDSDDDARRLVRLLAGFDTKVNLIPFNPHPLSPFGRPDDARVDAFRGILDKAGLRCFVRTTRGLDIDAACGMLGAKKLEGARRGLAIVDANA